MDDAQRLSRLLFEARELVDMLSDLIGRATPTAGANDWAQRVRDEIDEYRAERGWSAHGYGGEAEAPPVTDLR